MITRVLLALSVALLAISPSHGQTVGGVNSPYAVVKLYTHGASQTVIATGQGRSYLLGCGHAFEGTDRQKLMGFDFPSPTGWPLMEQKPTHRLVAVDYKADLSLVEVSFGPLPYVCQVAPLNWKLSQNILSVGYDKMTKYAVQVPTHVLTTTYTRERPVPGRSGGGLIDMSNGYLVGVCQGYETSGPQRGMYVDLSTIHNFLKQNRVEWLIAANTAPQPPPAVRGEEFPNQLSIPREHWVHNHSGSSCAWVSVECLCRWNGITALNGLGQKHPGPTGPGGPEGELRNAGVSFWTSSAYTGKNKEEVKWAIKKGWGAAVGLNRSHMVVAIGYDDKDLIVLENSCNPKDGPCVIRKVPWSQFDGWVIVIYGRANQQPQAPQPFRPVAPPVQNQRPCPT